MANGQVTTSGQGSVGRSITIALVGLALLASQEQVQASGGVVAALQGEASTIAAGTVVPTPSLRLFGLQCPATTGTLYPTGRSLVATAQGTSTPASSLALTGLASQLVQGLVTPNAADTVPLLGTAITSATGTLAVPGSFALTGSEATAEAGTLTPESAPNNSAGQSVNTEAGTLTPSVSDPVTVTLSGVEAVWTQGTFGTMTALTGAATTSAHGTTSPSHECSLTGQAMTAGLTAMGIGQDPNDTYILSQAGTTTQSADVPLAGTALTAAQGTLSISNDVSAVLTGEASMSAAGACGVSSSPALTGAESTSAQYPFGAPGYGALSGQVVTMGQGTVSITPDRTAAVTGQALTLVSGAVAVRPALEALSQVLMGATGTLGRIGGNMQQALTGAACTAAQGTCGVIGQDPNPPAVSAEGCGVTTETSAEGCGVTKARSVEARTITSRPAREV